MGKYTVKACNVFSLLKMMGVSRLQSLAACMLIKNNIYIPPFSIPKHLFEDLRILNSVRSLQCEEKLLQQKLEALERIEDETVGKFNEYRMMCCDVSCEDQDLSLDFFFKAEEYREVLVKINAEIDLVNARIEERTMEEELNLSNLSVEYSYIQFY